MRLPSFIALNHVGVCGIISKSRQIHPSKTFPATPLLALSSLIWEATMGQWLATFQSQIFTSTLGCPW